MAILNLELFSPKDIKPKPNRKNFASEAKAAIQLLVERVITEDTLMTEAQAQRLVMKVGRALGLEYGGGSDSQTAGKPKAEMSDKDWKEAEALAEKSRLSKADIDAIKEMLSKIEGSKPRGAKASDGKWLQERLARHLEEDEEEAEG